MGCQPQPTVTSDWPCLRSTARPRLRCASAGRTQNVAHSAHRDVACVANDNDPTLSQTHSHNSECMPTAPSSARGWVSRATARAPAGQPPTDHPRLIGSPPAGVLPGHRRPESLLQRRRALPPQRLCRHSHRRRRQIVHQHTLLTRKIPNEIKMIIFGITIFNFELSTSNKIFIIFEKASKTLLQYGYNY